MPALLGLPQPAEAGSVVDHGAAVPNDGDPRPGNGSLQKKFDGQRRGPSLGNRGAGAVGDLR
eukprot:15481780-Alexandrium_andersonii.AAC.1